MAVAWPDDGARGAPTPVDATCTRQSGCMCFACVGAREVLTMFGEWRGNSQLAESVILPQHPSSDIVTCWRSSSECYDVLGFLF